MFILTLLLVFFLCRRGDFMQNSRWSRVQSISGSWGSLLRMRKKRHTALHINRLQRVQSISSSWGSLLRMRKKDTLRCTLTD
jgi:hypothetical protein